MQPQLTFDFGFHLSSFQTIGFMLGHFQDWRAKVSSLWREMFLCCSSCIFCPKQVGWKCDLPVREYHCQGFLMIFFKRAGLQMEKSAIHLHKGKVVSLLTCQALSASFSGDWSGHWATEGARIGMHHWRMSSTGYHNANTVDTQDKSFNNNNKKKQGIGLAAVLVLHKQNNASTLKALTRQWRICKANNSFLIYF